jgi:hypothetical protein
MKPPSIKRCRCARSGNLFVQFLQLVLEYIHLVMMYAVESVEPDAVEGECESVGFDRGLLEVGGTGSHPGTEVVNQPVERLVPEAHDVVLGLAEQAQLIQQHCGIIVGHLDVLAVRVNVIHEVGHIRPLESVQATVLDELLQPVIVVLPCWRVKVRVGSWEVIRSVQPHEDDVWSQHLSLIMDELNQALGALLNTVTVGECVIPHSPTGPRVLCSDPCERFAVHVSNPRQPRL